MVKPEVSDINPMYFPKISDTRGFGLNPTNFKGLDAKGIYIYISPAISNWDPKKIISVGKQGKGCKFVGSFQGKCNPLSYPQEWGERKNKQEIKKVAYAAAFAPCFSKNNVQNW